MGHGHSHSSDFSDCNMDYLKQHTHFTSKEIHNWHKQFHQDFPDGCIGKEDFVRMCSKTFPKGDVHQYAEYVFRAYDTDGNGRIDFQEFMTTMSVSAKGDLNEKLKWVFHMYDLDNDGSVSLKEICKMIKAIYRMKGTYDKDNAKVLAGQIFCNMDKNKDETLSLQEFIQGAKCSKTIVQILQGEY